MADETFTDRYLQQAVVAKIDEHGAVTDVEGWTAIAPPDARPLLTPGTEYALEMQGGPFRPITGWLVHDQWFNHKSDQQIERERTEWIAERDREHLEQLTEHRTDWQAREDQLPGWLQDRLRVFHERGGETFERDGWAYELAICEVAALYAESGGEDDEKIKAYASEHGTSGNQHDCAKWLVKMHKNGETLAGTVSGLSPLTGNAYYEAKDAE